MRIYPRGKRGILWADFTVAGERFTRSTGTTDRGAAEEWAARAQADIWRQKRLGEKPRLTFGQVVLDWLEKHASERRSIEDMKDRLRWLVARVGDDPMPLRPARVTSILAGKTIDEETGKRPSAGTLNRYVAEVSKIHHHAHRMQWIDAVPAFRRYQEPKQAPRWLTREQADKLLAELPEHLRDMAQFALATGLRESNVRLLRWTQVDIARGVAWVLPDDAKNARALSVPLNADAIEVLMRQPRSGYVFTYKRLISKKRNEWKRAPVRNCSSHAWYKATARAGLAGFRWHDLRHTWATWHVMNGTPLPVLQQLGGWSSYAMVLRYAHVAPDFAAQYADGSLRDKSVTSSDIGMTISSQVPEIKGWLTGLEPATTGITKRQRQPKLLNLNDALARKTRKTG